MNFDPNIPTVLAVAMSLLAAFMWGSWFITLKYLGDYPLEAFYLTLFLTSMIIVWGIGFAFEGQALLGNIRDVWQTTPSRVTITLICGALYVTGILISLHVFQIIGLAVSQPIQASINIIGGTAVSAWIGGVPEDLTAGQIILAVTFLTAAVFLSMAAGRLRNKAQKAGKVDTGLSQDPKEITKAFILLIIGSLLIPAYTAGLSFGLRTITQPTGLAPLPFMAVLCTGAFISALVICGTILTKRHQWHVFCDFGFEIHRLGLIAGFAHYGGNIVHTFATRNLSSVVSWPLGVTSGLWTQMWGLLFGEFEGAPRRAYLFLGGGVLCYIAGAFIIVNII